MPASTAFAIVDAFTTRHPFSGNPAGVLLLDEFPDPGWMQGVADAMDRPEWYWPASPRVGRPSCSRRRRASRGHW